jgi:BlaI family penicillinase repressor
MSGRWSKKDAAYLSKREQQIMEIAFAHGRVTATELERGLPGRPSNSSVRTFLRILESKGHLQHIEEDGKYVYLPTQSKNTAARSAIAKLVDTFFGGNPQALIATLLSEREMNVSQQDLVEIQAMIDKASSTDKESLTPGSKDVAGAQPIPPDCELQTANCKLPSEDA